MLDVDPGIVAGITKLFGLFRVNKFGVDYVVLTLAPFEEFDVLFVFSLVIKVYLVLLDFFGGEVVAIEVG
jgi:hypothetical protein